FLAVDFDPLPKGYVANLSHPGGNVTGIFVRETELAAKRVKIAREALNLIWAADRGSVHMSKSSRVCFSIFGIVLPRACLPFRCHWQIGWLRLPLPVVRKRCVPRSFDLTTHLPLRLSTMNWMSAVI